MSPVETTPLSNVPAPDLRAGLDERFSPVERQEILDRADQLVVALTRPGARYQIITAAPVPQTIHGPDLEETMCATDKVTFTGEGHCFTIRTERDLIAAQLALDQVTGERKLHLITDHPHHPIDFAFQSETARYDREFPMTQHYGGKRLKRRGYSYSFDTSNPRRTRIFVNRDGASISSPLPFQHNGVVVGLKRSRRTHTVYFYEGKEVIVKPNFITGGRIDILYKTEDLSEDVFRATYNHRKRRQEQKGKCDMIVRDPVCATAITLLAKQVGIKVTESSG